METDCLQEVDRKNSSFVEEDCEAVLLSFAGLAVKPIGVSCVDFA